MYKRPEQKTYKKNYKSKGKSYIRSFRDLQVYQIAEKLSVDIITKIKPCIDEGDYPSKQKLIEKALDIPVMIAKSYTLRYDDKIGSHNQIKQAMADCNEIIVYVEQVRDIFKNTIDLRLCENLINTLGSVRQKMLNLKKTWEQWDIKDGVNLKRRKDDK